MNIKYITYIYISTPIIDDVNIHLFLQNALEVSDTFGTEYKLLGLPVPEIINELKDGNEVVSVAVALPVALCLDQGLLDLRNQRLVPLHHCLELR